MRALTTAQQNVRAAGNQAEHIQVLIDNGVSGLIDVATLSSPGQFSPVKSVQIRERIEDTSATLDLVLHREMYKWSFSPYVAGSGLNRIDATGKPAPTNALKPMLQLGNRVVVKIAVVAMDKQPSGGDYVTFFDGKIDTLDAAKSRDVQVTARLSPVGRLAQQYIKTERVYAYVDDGGQVSCRIWEPGKTYPAGTYVIPATRGSADSGFNRWFFTGAGGTTGASEPTWPGGGTVADGSVTWAFGGAPTTTGFPVEDVMNFIMGDNIASGESAAVITTPSSPGWQIRQFIQQRSFTLDALLALAHQIGWDLRPKWNGSSAFELTFYQPSRSSPSVDQTFQTTDYEDPSQLAVDISDIRNNVRVIYPDRADLWPDGTPKRKVVDVSDPASITKYSDLWMEIQEDQNANIDSITEATELANNALSDLSEPTAQVAVALTTGYPWVELNDYYTFKANSLHFDSDQSLAVTGYTHSYEASDDGRASLKTSLQLRGKPTIGADAWQAVAFHPNQAATQQATGSAAHQMAQFQGPQTPVATMTPTVGGARVSIAVDVDKRALESEYEVHVYPTPGTTLSSTTLKAVTKARTVELSDLLPAATYCVRIVPRHYNHSKLIRGQPSKEVTFVAGQAGAGHLLEGVAMGDYPLNGGFETRLDTAGMPDHWVVVPTFGVYGTDVQVLEDTNGISGGRYLRIIGKTSGSVVVNSALIPVVNEAGEAHRYSQLYRFSVWAKAATANTTAGALEVAISFYDYAGALVTTSSTIVVLGNVKKGHWVKYELYARADSFTTIRSALISLTANSSAAAYTIDVDEVRITCVGTRWYQVGDTTAFTENYDSIPPFNNTYLAHADSAPAFRKDRVGRVYLKGAARHATTSTVGLSLFTLPSPFWPLDKVCVIINANGKAATLEVSTVGVVTLTAATDANPSTKVSIDNVSWETVN